MSDLSEARKRYRAFGTATEADNHVYFHDPTKMTADLIAIANADKAEHPADDDEAIDEAWLRSVGFGFCGDIKLPNEDLELHVPMSPQSDWTFLKTDGEKDYCGGHTLTIPTPKTRGQLRRLCAALGIELTEKAREA